MANLILKQYKDDLKRSDETYDFFFNRLNSGDNTEASKLALLKSLELRMSSADMIAKLQHFQNQYGNVDVGYRSMEAVFDFTLVCSKDEEYSILPTMILIDNKDYPMYYEEDDENEDEIEEWIDPLL